LGAGPDDTVAAVVLGLRFKGKGAKQHKSREKHEKARKIRAQVADCP